MKTCCIFVFGFNELSLTVDCECDVLFVDLKDIAEFASIINSLSQTSLTTRFKIYNEDRLCIGVGWYNVADTFITGPELPSDGYKLVAKQYSKLLNIINIFA